MLNQTKSISVLLNGSKQNIPEGTTLEGLISQFKLEKKTVVIEHNHQVADKRAYRDIQLNEADQIEIVHFVGGG